MDETFGYSQCDFEFLTSRALIEEAWKNPHFGMNPSTGAVAVGVWSGGDHFAQLWSHSLAANKNK